MHCSTSPHCQDQSHIFLLVISKKKKKKVRKTGINSKYINIQLCEVENPRTEHESPVRPSLLQPPSTPCIHLPCPSCTHTTSACYIIFSFGQPIMWPLNAACPSGYWLRTDEALGCHCHPSVRPIRFLYLSHMFTFSQLKKEFSFF